MKHFFFCGLLLGAVMACASDSVPVLADQSFRNPKAWKAFGKSALLETVDGKDVLVLKSSDTGKDSRRSWRASTKIGKNGPAGKFTLTFEAKQENIVRGRPDYLWAGLTVLLHGHSEGKYNRIKTEAFPAGKPGFQSYAVRGMIPPNLDDLYLEFTLQEASGTVLIRNVSLTLDPIGAEAGKTIRTKVTGGRTVDLLPVPRHKVSSVPLSIGEKDFAFFDGTDTRQTYDASVPDVSLLISRAATFGTPGEIRDLFIGIHALRALKLNSVRISDLKSADGKVLPASSVGIYRVKNWIQGDGMGRYLSYSVIPEVLLPFEGAELPSNTSASLMFQFNIPANAAPGIYSGTIAFSADGAEKKLPVSLRVLPFTLVRPAVPQMCYLAHVSDFGPDGTKAEEICLDFKKRGIEGMLVACQYGKGTLSLKKGPDGQPYIASFEKLDRALSGYRSAGMTGPFIIHFSDRLEVEVAKAMKWEVPREHEAGGVNGAMNTPEFSRAVQKVLADLKERCKGVNLYIMCIDEPGGFIDRQERALWECREIQKAGLPASVYQFGPFWKRLKDYCPIQIFSSASVPGQSRKELADEAKKAGVRPYAYGLHGSYEGAPGGMMPGRARSGYLAHEEGFVGQTLWLYSPGKPTSFDGVEQLSFFPRLKYLDLGGRLVPTLQWEGICAGIDDYAYMNTLDALLKKHPDDPLAKKIAREYEMLRKRIEEQITPFSEEEEKIGRFTNSNADAVRWQIAEWIMELQRKEQGI